jgi:hypothetical protein
VTGMRSALYSTMGCCERKGGSSFGFGCEDQLGRWACYIGSASLIRDRVCGFLFGVLVWVASDSEADSLEFVTDSDAFVVGASAFGGLCRRKPRRMKDGSLF